MSTKTKQPLLTEEEVADRLKVKKNVVRGLREREEIKHVRIAANRVRYTEEDLEAYLDRCRKKAESGSV